MIIINLNEYRALYEYLKGRDSDKIKERYGTTAYNTMVGHRIEDQFLLSAIDVIKNEIRNVEQECAEVCKKADSDFDLAYKDLRTQRDSKKAEAERNKLSKIKELTLQVNELIKSSAGSATA